MSKIEPAKDIRRLDSRQAGSGATTMNREVSAFHARHYIFESLSNHHAVPDLSVRRSSKFVLVGLWTSAAREVLRAVWVWIENKLDGE